MTGQIPKYGAHFRRESRDYERDVDLATRAYVLKADPRYFIQSTRNSEKWTLFVSGPQGAAFPLGPPVDTLTQAMRCALAVHELVGT